MKAALEIPALPAIFPRVGVDGELAVSLSRPHSVHADLKNFPNQRPAELELLQVGINHTKACLHIFLWSQSDESSVRAASVSLETPTGAGPYSCPSSHGTQSAATTLPSAASKFSMFNPRPFATPLP